MGFKILCAAQRRENARSTVCVRASQPSQGNYSLGLGCVADPDREGAKPRIVDFIDAGINYCLCWFMSVVWYDAVLTRMCVECAPEVRVVERYGLQNVYGSKWIF